MIEGESSLNGTSFDEVSNMVRSGGDSGGSFWTSLPGILTGIAALITAVVGFYAVISPRDGRAPVPPPGRDTLEGSSGTQRGFRVVEATLRADPFNYEGPCPVIIELTGRISVVGGSGTVAYTFRRSDGASAPIEALTFTGPGSQSVKTTWQLGVDGSGWQQIEILEPVEMTSDRAEFTVRCR